MNGVNVPLLVLIGYNIISSTTELFFRYMQGLNKVLKSVSHELQVFNNAWCLYPILDHVGFS